jgi:hypothetical protein
MTWYTKLKTKKTLKLRRKDQSSQLSFSFSYAMVFWLCKKASLALYVLADMPSVFLSLANSSLP